MYTGNIQNYCCINRKLGKTTKPQKMTFTFENFEKRTTIMSSITASFAVKSHNQNNALRALLALHVASQICNTSVYAVQVRLICPPAFKSPFSFYLGLASKNKKKIKILKRILGAQYTKCFCIKKTCCNLLSPPMLGQNMAAGY